LFCDKRDEWMDGWMDACCLTVAACVPPSLSILFVEVPCLSFLLSAQMDGHTHRWMDGWMDRETIFLSAHDLLSAHQSMCSLVCMCVCNCLSIYSPIAHGQVLCGQMYLFCAHTHTHEAGRPAPFFLMA